MQSPFEIFRKHQKILTVILTGLAMFAFVILGAVPDPSNMPPTLVAIVLAGVLGGIGWVAGITSNKSKEWGTSGAIAGVILGIAAVFAVGPQDVVRADTGNIDQRQLQALHQQRQIANQFVNNAYQLARKQGEIRPPQSFGFGHPDPNRDVVVGELLRREADKIGLEVSDEAVNDFIVAISQGQLGADGIKEIRDRLGISESELYRCLSQELKSQEIANFLYSGTTLPPETYWEFYRKMNIQQSVGLVPVPVDAFVDKSVEPPESELEELFAKHRANLPNATPRGQLDEGLPGFRQPRKVELAYVEIPYEAVEETVGDVSDEEIEGFYQQYYQTIPSTDATADPDAPILPDLVQPNSSPEDSSSPETPEDSATEDSKNVPETESETDQSEEESDAKSPETPTSESTENPDTTPAGSDPEIPAKEEPPATKEEGEASLRRESQLQLVAFLDDAEPAGDDDKSADEKPADEKPAEEPPQPDEGDASSPSSPPPPATPRTRESVGRQLLSDEEGGSATPDFPLQPRELDDELRSEIRDQILRQRTNERMEELVSEINDFMLQDLLEDLYATMSTEDADQSPSYDQTGATLREFAEERNLVYDETGLLSYRQLNDSEDHPIGRAATRSQRDPMTNFQAAPSRSVPEIAFGAGPTELFRPETVLEIESGSRFVFWKIADEEAYEPTSLDDPGIREQVVTAWREMKARDLAKARADELAETAEGSELPLSEVFAETTVTGEEGSQVVSVVHPPRFSWLSSSNVTPLSLYQTPPTRTVLRSIPGQVGDDFMRTVVNDLQEGEVGVTHSYDQAYFYVVRVDDRTYGFSPDFEAFRDRFTDERVFANFGSYWGLAQQELGQYGVNWAQELFTRHNVDFSRLDQLESEPQG